MFGLSEHKEEGVSRAGPRALEESGVWWGHPCTGTPRGRGMLRPVWDLLGVRCLGNSRGKVFRRSQDPRSEAHRRSQDWYREGN